MGEDKAAILVDGVPQALRIAKAISFMGIPITVLGRNPIDGHGFLPDAEEFAGPLAALARFTPQADAVFVCSCDLPLFDARIIEVLAANTTGAFAAVPKVNGFRQPLCALYRKEAFAEIDAVLDQDGACPMRWLDSLEHVIVTEEELNAAGINPQCAQGANTQEEFQKMFRANQLAN